MTLVQKLNLVGGRTDFDTLAPLLVEMGYNLSQVARDIDEAILATVFAVDRYMHGDFMRYITGGREFRLRPFELFGLDILLDQKGKPHLLEINAMPDMRSGTRAALCSTLSSVLTCRNAPPFRAGFVHAAGLI